MACPAAQYYSMLSHKQHDFRGEQLLSTKCVFLFSLQLLSETYIILRQTDRDMIKMYIGLHIKYPLFSTDFNATWFFLVDGRKNPNITYHENPASGNRVVQCIWTDTNITFAFHNFVNVPKTITFKIKFTSAAFCSLQAYFTTYHLTTARYTYFVTLIKNTDWRPRSHKIPFSKGLSTASSKEVRRLISGTFGWQGAYF